MFPGDERDPVQLGGEHGEGGEVGDVDGFDSHLYCFSGRALSLSASAAT